MPPARLADHGSIDSGNNFASLLVENVAFVGIGNTGQATMNMLGDDPS